MGSFATCGSRQKSDRDSLIYTADRIAHWLLRNQQPDGRILDPVHRQYGTYSDGFAALTFGLLYLETAEQIWESACRRSLAISLKRPITSEFDQLAVLLLAIHDHGGMFLSNNKIALKLYQGNRVVSNNWVAMRALNYTLRAGLTGSRADDEEEATRLWDHVLNWQLPCGLFIDSPGGMATPVTYHAKFCATIALALAHTDNLREELSAALQQGLNALVKLISPAGVLVPYGRSRNSLFGYAAAILALSDGAKLFSQSQYYAAANRLLERLQRFQRPDGHIPAILNNDERTKDDWDVYLNNPDYNAYAAALLLLAAEYEIGSGDATPKPDDTEIHQIGDLLTVQRGSLYAAFATNGQSVPAGTPFFSDYRYYGMQPLWIERNGNVLFQPDAYRWPDEGRQADLVDPANHPWIPYLYREGNHYCVRRYDQVTVNHQSNTIEIIGEGQPEYYRPVARWLRRATNLLTERHGAVSPRFYPHILDGVRIRRRMLFDVETGRLSGDTEVIGDLTKGTTLCQSHTELTAQEDNEKF